MTTLTGRCMPLVEVQTPPSTARATDIMLQSTPLQRRYYTTSQPSLNCSSFMFIVKYAQLLCWLLMMHYFCFKQVTKRVDTAAGQWKSWNWRSEGDLLLNGAYFTPSGAGASASYARASSLGAKSSSMVGSMTANAGALGCRRGQQC